MALLSDDQYEEYIRLLREWVDTEKALKVLATPDPEAQERAAQAHAAVQSFRERYGLEQRKERALEGSASEVG